MSNVSAQRRRLFAAPLLISVALLSCPSTNLAAQQPGNSELDKAIATLRGIDPKKIPREQQEAVARDINAAWDAIRKAGEAGTARLREEIKREGQSDYFRLNGAALLWANGGLNEAEVIASVWRSTRLEVQSNYVFYPSFDAARTHDARALPMLKAILGNNKVHVYLSLHSMDVKWPLTLEFIWGAYGPKGLPVLNQILNMSADPIELQSAILLLTSGQYLDALPEIRKRAGSPINELRWTAIRSLGVFGHPQDRDLLLAGLKLKDEEDIFHHVYALYEYEDLSVAAALVPLLKMEKEDFRREVIAALMHLPQASGFDALYELCRAPVKSRPGDCDGRVDQQLKEMNLTWLQYAKMTAAQKATFFAQLRKKHEDSQRLLPRDKRLTHPQLMEAIAEWKANGRAFTDRAFQFEQGPGADPNKFTAKAVKYGWVSERHVLAVATPQDIEPLLEARASILRRLSDECLYEVRRINDMVRHLNRRRYRKVSGLSDRVEVP